jgi:YD repeat-containing protein
MSRNHPRGQPSATIYPCSKHIRTGRKADRYDSGLEAHNSNRPYPAVDGSHARPRYRASVRDRHSVTACEEEHVRYDSFGNITQQTNDATVETFSYDKLHRLIGSNRTGAATAISSANPTSDRAINMAVAIAQHWAMRGRTRLPA